MQPYGAFNYLPASWVFGKMENPVLAFITPLVAVVCFWIAEKIWNWGLSQYQSTGS